MSVGEEASMGNM